MARYGVVTLRVALGVVFLWFGALKYFPDLSPAQTLALKTIEALTVRPGARQREPRVACDP